MQNIRRQPGAAGTRGAGSHIAPKAQTLQEWGSRSALLAQVLGSLEVLPRFTPFARAAPPDLGQISDMLDDANTLANVALKLTEAVALLSMRRRHGSNKLPRQQKSKK